MNDSFRPPASPALHKLDEAEPRSIDVLLDYVDNHMDEYVRDLIQICELPAPTFHEEKRGRFFASFFPAENVQIDDVGNVIVPVSRKGDPHVVLSAHLDTVFPFEEIAVNRTSTLLQAPGVSDDSAGLASLILLYRAFSHGGFLTRGSLTLLATVGEEGLGNLRGARNFFEKSPDHVDYFISLDGCDAERLVTVGLASKRFRILLRGPGGHSWGDAGLANPIHAAGEFLSKVDRLVLPPEPKTTLNVGIISGGTSINTIPTEMSMDLDLRSESMESLMWLDQWLHKALQETLENRPTIHSELMVVGERPAGRIAEDQPLVQQAISANRRFGLDAKLETGSTDSNIPFSLGIPAITTGVGGRSGKIHTPEEWYDFQGAEAGIKRTAFLLAELLYGMAQ